MLQRLTELPQHAIEEHYLIHSIATSTFEIVSLQSQVKQNFETLKPLVVKNIISENMAKKTLQSGLSYFHFKLTFSKKKNNKRKLEIFLQRKPMTVSELSNRKKHYFFSHKFYPRKITLSIRRKTKTFTWIVCKHIQRNLVF